MDAKKFGTFVADVRKQKGMTQADLADKLQVTDKAISRWERGLGFPDIELLEPLSDALGLSVLELLQSQHITEQEMTIEDVSQTFIETIDVAKAQMKMWRQIMGPGVKFCVSDFRQSQEGRWKAGRILACIP